MIRMKNKRFTRIIALLLCAFMLFTNETLVYAVTQDAGLEAVTEQSEFTEEGQQEAEAPETEDGEEKPVETEAPENQKTENAETEIPESYATPEEEPTDVELGYIFEYPTEQGKDVFIQLGDKDDNLSELILTVLDEGVEKEVEADTLIQNVVAFHLKEDSELLRISGKINGKSFSKDLKALDGEEGQPVSDGGEEEQSPEEEAVDEFVATDVQIDVSAIGEAAQKASEDIPTMFAAGKKPVVVIDPGHSKKSTGTYKTWDGVTYREEELTMKIARYAKEALEKYGNVEVYLTRDENGNPSLYDRVKFAKDKGAAILVSIHLNSAGSTNEVPTSANGVEAMVAKIGSYNPENAQNGQNLAGAILEELVGLGFKDRGFVFKTGDQNYEDGSKADYYGIVRYGQQLKVPSIIVEHGFLNNESDFRTYLSTESGLKSLGEADARGIAKYLGLGFKEGWNVDANGDRYYIQNGVRLTGWQVLDGKTYYFDSNGKALVGTPLIEGKKYWFGATGEQQTGWLNLMGMRMYFDPGAKGASVTGIKEVGGSKYIFDSNGVRIEGNGTPTYNGKKYYLVNSVLQTGWLQLGGWKLYFNPQDNGAAAVGVHVIDGKVCYFDANGIMSAVPSGMFVVNGKKYYVLPNGSFYTGWLQLTADWRLYFDPNDNGAAATGVRTINSKTYYFDANGVMLKSTMPLLDGKKYYLRSDGTVYTGWLQLTADWRLYFDPNDQGAAATGFRTINSKIYHFDNNGIMRTSGMPVIDGKKYYVSSDGSFYTGWLQLTSTWRLYFDPKSNGAAVTGFKDIDSKTYYFDANGIMQTAGMPIISGKKYYVKNDGSFHKGWLQLTTTWRLYCDPKDNGAVLTGFQTVGGNRYYFDANGIMAIGFVKIQGKQYYFNESGIMSVSGTPIINGQKYAFKADGEQIFGWYQLGDFKLYFNPNNNGAAVTGYIEIDNVVYQFNADGILIDSQVKYVTLKDPLNGKTYTLEGTYLTDPKIGVDITEDEFFASVLYTEAGNQGYAGQVAVAMTILNRSENSSFPSTLSFVIYTKNQFEVARNGTLTKYLKAFKNDDENTLLWLRKAKSLEAVQEARRIMNEYKSNGANRTIQGITMPAGQNDFNYLFFMTQAAFDRLGLDADKCNSLVHNGHIFFEKWIKA